MKLVQLVYFSKCTSPSKEKKETIESILSKAQRVNDELGISGLLVFSNDFYIQALEGPRNNVNDLYFRIQGDPRHTDPQMLLYRDINQRDFGEWSMAWANETNEKRDMYFKYCATRNFVPSDLTGQGGLSLLQEFALLMKAK